MWKRYWIEHKRQRAKRRKVAALRRRAWQIDPKLEQCWLPGDRRVLRGECPLAFDELFCLNRWRLISNDTYYQLQGVRNYHVLNRAA